MGLSPGASVARGYDVDVVLGAAGKPPPWQSSVWREIAALLDPVLAGASGAPAVRTLQLAAPPGRGNKGLTFGRIGWSASGAAKWTHIEDGRLADGRSAFFLSCEVWAPGWTHMGRGEGPPDVFLALGNDRHLRERAAAPSGSGFDNVVVLACARDLPPESGARAAEATAAISALLDAPLYAHAQKPWAESKGSYSINAINDMPLAGLFKPGPRHSRPLDLGLFVGEWERR